MKIVILTALASVAIAAPRPEDSIISAPVVDDVPTTRSQGYSAPVPRSEIYVASSSSSRHDSEEVAILRDDRVHEEDGRYNVDVETGNGIVLSQSGSPDGADGSVVMAGQYSYTAPDGTPVLVKFVANENGYQPESDLLPVAPEFPHPIPQFVLDQIAFAAQEDAARARSGVISYQDSSEESFEDPAPSYNSPQ